jgi:hypothetical protein
MRSRVSTIAIAAALLAVLGGLAIAQAATGITEPETLVLFAHGGKAAHVDVGDKGYSSGDVFMFSIPLNDETDTTRVGVIHYECTVQPGNGWELCSAALDITDRGMLVSTGSIHFTDATTYPMPVTGGTGDFANVRGDATIEVVDNDTYKYTFSLLP